MNLCENIILLYDNVEYVLGGDRAREITVAKAAKGVDIGVIQLIKQNFQVVQNLLYNKPLLAVNLLLKIVKSHKKNFTRLIRLYASIHYRLYYNALPLGLND